MVRTILLLTTLPAMPVLLLWLFRHGAEIGDIGYKVWRTVRPAPPVPAPSPIERLAADLRRLSGMIRQYETPESVVRVKWLAAHRAYEDRLVEACAELGISHRLDSTEGWEHTFELARAERALAAAGLSFTPVVLDHRGGQWPRSLT